MRVCLHHKVVIIMFKLGSRFGNEFLFDRPSVDLVGRVV